MAAFPGVPLKKEYAIAFLTNLYKSGAIKIQHGCFVEVFVAETRRRQEWKSHDV